GTLEDLRHLSRGEGRRLRDCVQRIAMVKISVHGMFFVGEANGFIPLLGGVRGGFDYNRQD
ncbi:MAG: hypothetical protein L3K26_16265, partial [Candidatus Hydrogenedentes bacterium]|nr:hypothetical protein [Candidatus Hydrogenedentota bacterium]